MKVSFDFNSKDLDKTIKNIEDQIGKAAKDVLSDSKVLGDVSIEVVKDIRFRTKLGKDAEGSNFKPLTQSESGTYWPNYYRNQNVTDPAFKYGKKSRLTFTGRLLKSISAEIQGSAQRIRLFFEGDHEGYNYKRKDGSSGKTPSLSNDQLATYVQKERPFFKYVETDSLTKRIFAIVQNEFRRRLSSYVRKK
jgi:hypothetical protein